MARQGDRSAPLDDAIRTRLLMRSPSYRSRYIAQLAFPPRSACTCHTYGPSTAESHMRVRARCPRWFDLPPHVGEGRMTQPDRTGIRSPCQ
jgi:hypothetical protein